MEATSRIPVLEKEPEIGVDFMSRINVSGLTFCYEGSYDNIFENASFYMDTDWKLGLIGRNGKGKTTLLNLLMGRYEYEGSIQASVDFDYFPFPISENMYDRDTIDVIGHIHPDYELWKICRELDLLNTDAGILYRPYRTLSPGEQTKVMLAVLFSRDNAFLLIDEPTNHLDAATRATVQSYLITKKGFILVSHDRNILDAVIDHVLVLEKDKIRTEKGNFTSWWENKQRRDAFELAENEKLKQEIKKLEASARRTAVWADKVERKKIGFNPIEEPDRCKDTRCYIGEKSRRMQQRRKNLENRQNKAIDEKSKLLKNLDEAGELKLTFLQHHKEVYIRMTDFQVYYGENGDAVTAVPAHPFYGDSGKNSVTVTTVPAKPFHMELKRGERVALAGQNGCGKSSIIKSILLSPDAQVLGGIPVDIAGEHLRYSGSMELAKGLKISYIRQNSEFLNGPLDHYIDRIGVSNSLFKAVLRQLDFDRVQFDKPMDEYSDGQKKKVLVAGSLLQQAHLYIWDEPLNYMDVFSRMQIEKLILKFQPTMLLVEHDGSFAQQCATRTIEMTT